MNKAIFAAGCFWGVEQYFRNLKGVLSTKVGYSGGDFSNPSYEDVCKGITNHAEVVLLEFDESIITYEQLINCFWKCHDPTQLNRQGVDIGDQYRSAIYYFSKEQKKIAEKSKERMQNNIIEKIVTEIAKAKKFYVAEDYHQCFLQKKL